MTRPSYYPYHDVGQTNFPAQPFLYALSGYPSGLPVPSADHNYKFNSNYLWQAYLDQGTLRNTDWLSSTNVALSTSVLTYNIGGNVTTTGATVATYASYLINDNRVEIDDAALNGVGAATMGSPLVMPGAITPGRIWVYVTPAGVTRFEAVAPATADAPIGSEIALVGLDVDALGVVTDGAVVPTTLPLPNYQVEIIAPLLVTGTGTMLSVVAGGGADPAVFIDGQADTGLSVQSNSVDPTAVFKQSGAGTAITAQGSVSITANLTASGNTTLGTGAGNTTTTIGADSTDALSVVAAATFTNLVTCNGDVTLGNADTDALIVVATSTFQNNVYLGVGAGNKTVEIGTADLDALTVYASTTFNADIDFGANTITGAGGTITTSTVNATTVVPTQVRYNTTTSASNNGYITYDGYTLTLGDGSSARRIHSPKTTYVVSDTTTLAIEDITGASVTMVIEDDQWVFFELTVAHTLSANDTLNVLLAATNGVDSVVVLNSGDDDAASYGFAFGAAQKITQSLTVRWKPTNDIPAPANTSWTIRVRHGIAGGNTLTSSNVRLDGWYEQT